MLRVTCSVVVQRDMQLLSITVAEDQMSLVHPVGALEGASSR